MHTGKEIVVLTWPNWKLPWKFLLAPLLPASGRLVSKDRFSLCDSKLSELHYKHKGLCSRSLCCERSCYCCNLFSFFLFFCSMQFKFVHPELINRSNNSFHSGVFNFPINLGSKKQLEGNEGHLCFSIALLYTGVYCWTFARLHNMFLIIQKNKNSTQFQTIKQVVY